MAGQAGVTWKHLERNLVGRHGVTHRCSFCVALPKIPPRNVNWIKKGKCWTEKKLREFCASD